MDYHQLTKEALIELLEASQQTGQQLEKIRFELNERIKELTCHNELTILLSNADLNAGDVLNKVIGVILPAWQFPERTTVSIQVKDIRVMSPGFRKSRYCLSRYITIDHKKAGVVTICYDDSYAYFEPVFLPEEEALITTIALRIAAFIDRNEKSTVRLEAEKKLSESENRFRNMVEQINDVVFEVDAQGIIKFVSPAITKMLGYSPEEITGSSFFNFMYAEDIPQLVHALQNLANTDFSYLEYRYHKKDGDVCWVRSSTTPVFTDGEMTGGIGVLSNINERKLAEIELKKFRTIADRSNYGTAFTDLQGTILYINAAFASMHGYKPEELLGKSLAVFHNEEQLPVVGRLLEELKATGEFNSEEVWHVRRDGSVFPTLMNATLIRDDKDTPLFFSTTALDISELKQHEQAILELNASLEKRIEERTAELASSNESLTKEIAQRIKAQEFENEMLQLSPQLTGITLTQIENALNLSLSRIGKFLGADRTYIFEFNPSLTEMSNTYEWCNEGILAVKSQLQHVSVGMLCRFMEVILRHENIVIEDIDSLPDSWSAEKKLLQDQGVQSLIIIPMISESQIVGFVGIDSVKSKRIFAESEVNILKIWSSMLVSLINNYHAEQLIEQSSQMFATAFQSNAALMAVSDYSEGQYVDVNETFLRTVGYTREEIIGSTNQKLGLFVDESLRKLILEKLENNEQVRDVEVEVRDKKGCLQHVLLSAVVLYVGDRKCLLTVSIDINDRRKAEEEMRKARIEAEKANVAKSEFLSRMSHELRTPMNSILGFAQILEMGELNSVQKRSVSHILKSGKHLLGLINEVLDISRIEAGRLAISIEPIKLVPLVDEMIDIITPIAREKKIRVIIPEEIGNKVFVKSDRQSLKQILLNLLNNALKYNKPEGSVFIEVAQILDEEANERKVEIAIRDTGIGIAEDDIPKLFTPFERIGAQNTNIEGTGLGLTVVKKLIDHMGGEIKVESVKGEGSTFRILLPAAESQLNGLNHSEVAGEVHPESYLKKGKILYIEDNASNIELVEQILIFQRPDVQLISNMNGQQAVVLALEFRPDLILLDLNLPDIHGNEVLAMLQGNPLTRKIPVVVLSADAMHKQIEIMMAAGAKSYLTKPLEVTDFLRVIDTYI